MHLYTHWLVFVIGCCRLMNVGAGAFASLALHGNSAMWTLLSQQRLLNICTWQDRCRYLKFKSRRQGQEPYNQKASLTCRPHNVMTSSCGAAVARLGALLRRNTPIQSALGLMRRVASAQMVLLKSWLLRV